MIQPNSSGGKDAAEVEAGGRRSDAVVQYRGGSRLRTSMSRDGAITPPRGPRTLYRHGQTISRAASDRGR